MFAQLFNILKKETTNATDIGVTYPVSAPYIPKYGKKKLKIIGKGGDGSYAAGSSVPSYQNAGYYTNKLVPGGSTGVQGDLTLAVFNTPTTLRATLSHPTNGNSEMARYLPAGSQMVVDFTNIYNNTNPGLTTYYLNLKSTTDLTIGNVSLSGIPLLVSGTSIYNNTTSWNNRLYPGYTMNAFTVTSANGYGTSFYGNVTITGYLTTNIAYNYTADSYVNELVPGYYNTAYSNQPSTNTGTGTTISNFTFPGGYGGSATSNTTYKTDFKPFEISSIPVSLGNTGSSLTIMTYL